MERGFELLESMPRDKIVSYQPYWALAAHLHMQLGDLRKPVRLIVVPLDSVKICPYGNFYINKLIIIEFKK